MGRKCLGCDASSRERVRLDDTSRLGNKADGALPTHPSGGTPFGFPRRRGFLGVSSPSDTHTTQNLMIEGDNLEVLKLLQKSYAGKVKLIYIDPPYNTGKDFVYPDDFQDNIKNYQMLTGQIDSDGRAVSSNTEMSGRFHTDWLNMMYPRIKLARNLLREDGVMFIQIGEGEVANLKLLCDSVFGEETCLGIACRVAKKSNNKGDHWAPNFDYVLTYAKDRSACPPFSGGINTEAYDQIETEGTRKGEKYQLVRLYMSTIENRNPEQRFWIECPDGTKVIPPGETFPPERPKLGDGIWRWSRTKFEAERDRIVVKAVRSSNLISDTGEPAKWNVFTKTYLSDVIENASSKPNNLVEEFINQIGSHEMTDLGIPFDYPKPSTLIEFLIGITRTSGNDLVLDFFAGSGSSGHAVMSANDRDALVHLPPQRPGPDPVHLEKAIEWLIGELAPGPQPYRKIMVKGGAAGFSQRTLIRAKASVAIQSVRIGLEAWNWALAEAPPAGMLLRNKSGAGMRPVQMLDGEACWGT